MCVCLCYILPQKIAWIIIKVVTSLIKNINYTFLVLFVMLGEFEDVQVMIYERFQLNSSEDLICFTAKTQILLIWVTISNFNPLDV